MPSSTTPGLTWSSGYDLGKNNCSEFGAAPQADGCLRLFVRSSYPDDFYGRLRRRDDSWDSWSKIPIVPTTIDGVPTALRGSDGIIGVFWRSRDDGLWAVRQTALNTDGWGTPERLAPQVASDPAVALGADGRISVFCHGTDRALWLVEQQRADRWAWAEPRSLGGDAGGSVRSAPAAARSGDGRLHVFTRDAADELRAIAQDPADPSGGTWGGYARVSTPGATVAGRPFAATDADQRVRVFWRVGTTGWHAVQGPGYANWTAPQALPGSTQETPAAVLTQDGRLAVFLVGTDRQLWIASQKRPGADDFAGPESLGGSCTGTPTPARTQDNRVTVALREPGSDSRASFRTQQWTS
ncbi:hypothetical protein [Streptomyces netropsis]|uniref:PLL-like beta propeller domain-containing protein n=1 Tax=Streptomyces netropsis TaxID=55404 RepID=A0A7W7PGF2_STRNE|nr:hypothetical protein [Streptomyces netropsis]MBB4888767.1 hypothetical protein [Streptomyces netropsis]GGR14937.1 hypothetical protein GCM10010219_19780 [Streptomyces netropsis]